MEKLGCNYDLKKDGISIFPNTLSSDELFVLREAIYTLIKSPQRTGSHYSDLSEDIFDGKFIQIMWPSLYIENLLEMKFFSKILNFTKKELGLDMEHDFNMMFYKAPMSNSLTPTHQDFAYWPNLPDKRAVSCWIALDKTDEKNGCIQYFIGHRFMNPIRHIFYSEKNRMLTCEINKELAVPIALDAGDSVFHMGWTPHFSGPNTTNSSRAALIFNFRPRAMIEFERRSGFDHGKTNNLRQNRNTETQ